MRGLSFLGRIIHQNASTSKFLCPSCLCHYLQLHFPTYDFCCSFNYGRGKKEKWKTWRVVLYQNWWSAKITFELLDEEVLRTLLWPFDAKAVHLHCLRNLFSIVRDCRSWRNICACRSEWASFYGSLIWLIQLLYLWEEIHWNWSTFIYCIEWIWLSKRYSFRVHFQPEQWNIETDVYSTSSVYLVRFI